MNAWKKQQKNLTSFGSDNKYAWYNPTLWWNKKNKNQLI